MGEKMPTETAEKNIGKEKPAFGANVVLSVDLIRHPEKEYETGDLTESGKRALLEKLNSESAKGYDTHKFYVSPHKRPQQTREVIQAYLDEQGIDTTIRDKKELFGRANELSSETERAFSDELVERGLIEQEEIDEASERKTPGEPVTKDFEQVGNEFALQEFFDNKFPESHLSGRDVGEEIEKLVAHFGKLAKRLKSDSKVKITMIGHSGITEHFMKLVYLKNHPEVEAKDVTAEDIGGLLEYLEGPTVDIRTDEEKKEHVTVSFNGETYNLNATEA